MRSSGQLTLGRLRRPTAACRAAAFGAWVCCALLCCAADVRAEQPKGKFEVHDLSLWIMEPGGQQANLRTAYPSALPPTVSSSRNGPAAKPGEALVRRVAPINLMTFHGSPATNLDVDLRTKAGTFLAHWPAGEGLPNRLRWAGMPALDLVEKIEDQGELAYVDSDHWIHRARAIEALFVRRGARSERFLAYDVELTLPAPIRLEGGPDKYTVINISGATLHDVLISRATPQGRRIAWLDVLPAASSTPKPAAPAEPPKAAPADLFDDGKSPAAPAAPPTAKPAAEKDPSKDKAPKQDDKPAPAAAPAAADPAAAAPAKAEAPVAADKPAPTAEDEKRAKSRQQVEKFFSSNIKRKSPAAVSPGKGVEVTLSEPLAADAADTAAKTVALLTERLTRTGLTPGEVELFVSNYRSLFFEGEDVVVACRIGQGTIDEAIPLSVFPEPTKMLRVAMVVQRNADPQLGNEVDRLVTQLGDAKFSAREAAHKRLMELGPLAFATLNKALNNADQEIVIRAERILLFQNQTPTPQGQSKPATTNGAVGAGGGGAGAAGAVIIKK